MISKEWFFREASEPRTPTVVIRWWEERRLAFNLFVFVVGSCSFLAFLYCIVRSGTLKPGEDAVEPMALVLVWIPVNVCYTLGWFIEVVALSLNVRSRYLQGPVLLRVGLVITLLMLLAPSVAWAIVLFFRLRQHLAT